MKEIAVDNGEIRVFAGGQTKVDTLRENIPEENIINKPCHKSHFTKNCGN